MAEWWRTAVVYQVYIRSFADGNADGTGDLTGLRARLPYLADLGVDAIWINPWYPSPLRDGGYDVADYRDIHPVFGTLAEAEAMITQAHDLGLRVIADIVPNHTSSEHAWFIEALAAPADSPQRARYWFRNGRGRDGALPPNNWRSTFGGSAWTRVTEPDGRPGQWYLHLFDESQPDLNWSNPEVVAEFLDMLRFWFDRGIDGFRIDVGHGLVKDPALPDLGIDAEGLLLEPAPDDHPHWDRPGVHEIYRGWRALADSYPEPRMFVGEVWVDDPARLTLYLRPDELHTSFAFELVDPDWDAAGLRSAITSATEAAALVAAPVTWVLSNHDIPRHVSRFGRPPRRRERWSADRYEFTGLDLDLGRTRARAAALLLLGLPGSAYLYQGEELGLEEVTDIPDHLRDDPVFHRSGGSEVGRDGCRVPLPWEPTGESFGFGADGAWLPQPTSWSRLSVATQQHDPDSMLGLYRRALAIRHREPALLAGPMTWQDSPPEVLRFVRSGPDGDVVVVVNLSRHRVRLPVGEVLLASSALPHGELPPDAAAWVRTTSEASSSPGIVQSSSG